MSIQKKQLITIFGGSGFIGRYVVRALAAKGHRLRIAVRRPDLAKHLQPLGDPGQIMPVQANVRFSESVVAACIGADTVINLTGILDCSGEQTFESIHVEGAEIVARDAKEAGAKNFIHMSAIGADAGSPSQYGISKAEGEKRVLQQFENASIIRPSVVFGQEDRFFNLFAGLTKISMVLPLIGGGGTRLQPVFAGDVGEAIARLTELQPESSVTYELGGPQIYSLEQLLQFILKTVERKRFLVPVPWIMAELAGSVLGLMPNPMLTREQVKMLKRDNIVSAAANDSGRNLEGLGIIPETVEEHVPLYLFRYRKSGQFSETGDSTI